MVGIVQFRVNAWLIFGPLEHACEDHLGSARTFEGQRGRGVYLDEITGIKSNDRNENRRFYLFFVIFRNENTILSLF